jgi:hypothetical protein
VNLIVRLARDNSSWGYDRIAGALANLGHKVSDQTVGNTPRRRGIAPAPKRSQTTSWKEFIRAHVGWELSLAERLSTVKFESSVEMARE